MLGIALIIIFFWFPITLVIWKNVLWDLYLWQVKEYRFDRMISHLLNQEEDLKQSTPIYVTKLTSLAALLAYLFFQYDILLVFTAVLFAVYVYEGLLSLQQTFGGRLIRPKISFRNILVLFLTLTSIIIPFAIILYPALLIYRGQLDAPISTISPAMDLFPRVLENGIKVFPAATLAILFSALFGVMLDLITPIIVSFWVGATEPIAIFKRGRQIAKAKKIISSNPKLKIIGITGSYGKTTTKELVAQILESKFNVAKTPQNYNSAVGVAISVIQNVKKDTEIFVAEMGAYTKNEVKNATDVVKPDISIVTGIDSQHITLFGSIENTLKAKFEIIDNAKETAKAILNGDNEYCLRMAEMTSKDKIIYFTAKDNSKIITSEHSIKRNGVTYHKNTTLYATNIKRSNKGITFKLNYMQEKYTVEANVKGLHNVSNLLAAIACCLELGMKLSEVVKIINSKKFVTPYLNTQSGSNNTIILDDGYNSSETGFLSALDELKEMKGNKKVILTKGIIELGKERDRVYKKIAERIVKEANAVITTDMKFKNALNAVDSDFMAVYAANAEEFVKAYNKVTQEGDIVLIEGAMYNQVLNEIIDKD